MTRQILVTGGISGIGRAIAEGFAAEGCRVTVTAKTREEVEQAQLFRENVRAYALDNTQPSEISAVIATLEQLDVLVNAAGMILRDGKEFEPENFENVVNVNLNGTLRMCSAARELLFVSRGCVINIASMLSFFGSGHAPAYSASKGGVAQLTKSLAIVQLAKPSSMEKTWMAGKSPTLAAKGKSALRTVRSSCGWGSR